jgi:integrase
MTKFDCETTVGSTTVIAQGALAGLGDATGVDEFCDWFTLRLRRTKGFDPSPNTLNVKRSRARSLLRWSEAGTVTQLAPLLADREQTAALVDFIHARMGVASTAQVVQVLKQLGEFCVALGLIDAHAVRAEDRPSHIPLPAIVTYTAEEVEAFVSAARGVSLRWWAFLATLADTGRRVGEVLSLQWSCLHLDGEAPYFDLPHTKNRRQAFVPLSQRLRTQVFVPEVVHRLRVVNETGRTRSKSQTVFPFPWSYMTAYDRFGDFCDRTGLPNRGFHCFRHTKATEMLTRGVPIQAVSALLGHSSVATTDRVYNHATALNFAHYLE